MRFMKSVLRLVEDTSSSNCQKSLMQQISMINVMTLTHTRFHHFHHFGTTFTRSTNTQTYKKRCMPLDYIIGQLFERVHSTA